MSEFVGNKGEWSEIYVFLRLLEAGKLYAADKSLNKIDSVFYDVLKIIRQENLGLLEFVYHKDSNTISVVKTDENKILLSLDSSRFKQEADNLYNHITQNNSPSFEIPDTALFLNEIFVDKLKAKSTDKSDIRIKIHDSNTGIEAIQGFSIKSRLGKPSTLLNAGTSTNFIYEIKNNINDALLTQFNTAGSFKERFNLLKTHNCSCEFFKTENIIFQNNLTLIDGDLPIILATALLLYYQDGINHISDAVKTITELNPLHYNLSNQHPFYLYKMKKFLCDCALGLLPSKVWTGIADATGGYIIVREDGEVFCYHLFNRNEFENYLIENTRFETASTTRHDFGHIFKQNNKFYLSLNLQIRFIK